ncbi:MAG TPA: tetratricopeptide repeat protein [Hellea balneolensis]|uniref:Tetratricopeptide repeat protein n=1 Tax=Hellea balneolensis TaxID=287478 RepID=A0A7V5NY22_9PROT|nr:tetratricopeptide repeat protein [Hellea balneolensis]
MVDFINEVEEELRKDKYNALLRKYGPYILGLIIVIIAGTGFLEYKKYRTTKLAKAASASYMAAARLEKEGDLQKAQAKYLALSKVAPDGYAGLSLERAAGIAVRLGNYDKAVNLLDQAVVHYSDKLHKDLAALKAVYILMDAGRYADVELRAGALVDGDSPYRDLAQEIQAQAEMKSGKIERARKTFTYLANAPGVQAGVKARAGQALALLKAKKSVEALPEAKDVQDKSQTRPSSQTNEPKSSQDPK